MTIGISNPPTQISLFFFKKRNPTNECLPSSVHRSWWTGSLASANSVMAKNGPGLTANRPTSIPMYGVEWNGMFDPAARLLIIIGFLFPIWLCGRSSRMISSYMSYHLMSDDFFVQIITAWNILRKKIKEKKTWNLRWIIN